MDHRLDALLGFARVVEAVNGLGLEQGAEGRATVGMANIFPNSRNVVPGRVFFSVEFRHPDEAVLARQDQQLRDAVARIADGVGLQHSVKQIFKYAPIAFDAGCVEVVRASAEALGYSHRPMISGAGHDAYRAWMALATTKRRKFPPRGRRRARMCCSRPSWPRPCTLPVKGRTPPASHRTAAETH